MRRMPLEFAPMGGKSGGVSLFENNDPPFESGVSAAQYDA